MEEEVEEGGLFRWSEEEDEFEVEEEVDRGEGLVR